MIKKPDSQEEQSIVEEILRKAREKEEHTIEEMQFAIQHFEYFIDSKELEKIDRESEEMGKILQRCCIRNINIRAWTR